MNTPTLITTPAPKAREGAWLWMFKIFAGVMLIALLLLHFVVNHLVATSGLLSYAEIVRYYTIPLIPIIEVIFLIFAVSHALVGLRSILLDLNPSDRILRLADAGLILLGTVSIIYGIWLVQVVASRGAGG